MRGEVSNLRWLGFSGRVKSGLLGSPQDGDEIIPILASSSIDGLPTEANSTAPTSPTPGVVSNLYRMYMQRPNLTVSVMT
jgi:hypothetical protein